MDLQNIIITSKQPEYKENERLNFLLTLVCYVHNYVPALVRLSNGIGLHLKQYATGGKIVVHFCQNYYCICVKKPHISSIYTEVAQKQGKNQITVKQRKNGNSPDTDYNEFL